MCIVEWWECRRRLRYNTFNNHYRPPGLKRLPSPNDLSEGHCKTFDQNRWTTDSCYLSGTPQFCILQSRNETVAMNNGMKGFGTTLVADEVSTSKIYKFKTSCREQPVTEILCTNDNFGECVELILSESDNIVNGSIALGSTRICDKDGYSSRRIFL